MVQYKLINPYIEGELQTTFDASSPDTAAKKAWNTLSSVFTNDVPQFAFTLQAGGKLHHYKVKETIKNNQVNFNMTRINNVTAQNEQSLINGSKNAKAMAGGAARKGGKRKIPKDDDEDDDEHGLYNRIKYHKMLNTFSPMSYMWYYPYIYDIPFVYMPTFVAPINPYVEILVSDLFK